MPVKMDGNTGQTMDQLGLGGAWDTNTMDYQDLKTGAEIKRVPHKGVLIFE